MEMQLNREILVWKSIEKLTEVINDPKNLASVKQRAVNALGNIGHSDAVPVLLKVLKEDEDNSLIIETIKALGKLPNECVDEENSEDVEKVLIKLLSNKYTNSMYRPHIIKALGKIGTIKAVPSLINALKKGDNLSRKCAAKALGNIGSQEAIPALLKALSDIDMDVYRASAMALGKLNSSEFKERLLKDINCKDVYVQSRAINNLGYYNKQTDIHNDVVLLIQTLSHESWIVRLATIKTLGKYIPSKDINLLRALHNVLFVAINDSCAAVQKAAIEIIERESIPVP
jgi:HEAT repeat protein